MTINHVIPDGPTQVKHCWLPGELLEKNSGYTEFLEKDYSDWLVNSATMEMLLIALLICHLCFIYVHSIRQ